MSGADSGAARIGSNRAALIAVIAVVFVVFCTLLISSLAVIHASIVTGDMENTIMVNDRVVAFRLSYLTSAPKRFDIVVFRFPDDESQLFVKRVIGLPGETVQVKDGKVYINGSDTPLRDDFINNGLADGDFGPYTVPEGHYFIMGDNRENSLDSRYWTNKYVAKGKILGKVIFRYYPGFKMLYGL